MSDTNSFEDHLWEFLNLEKNDQDGLSKLADKLSKKDATQSNDREKYFKLKLKIVLAFDNMKSFTNMNINISELNINTSDDCEMVLLKSQLFSKFDLQLVNFKKNLKDYIDVIIESSSDVNSIKDDLLQFYNDNFVLKPSKYSEKKKTSLKYLEGEPVSQENETIIEKFKDLLNNNEIYAKINEKYKPSIQDLYHKSKLLVSASFNDKDKNYYFYFLILTVIGSVTLIKGYKYINKNYTKLCRKIKLLIELLL
ncbi:hypothetical protein QEN19_000568 [Hanseniaspora menglaensis]